MSYIISGAFSTNVVNVLLYIVVKSRHFFLPIFVLKPAKFEDYASTQYSSLIILSHYRLNLSIDTMTYTAASIWSFDKHVTADTFDHASVFLLSKLLNFADKPFDMTAYCTRAVNILPVSIYTLMPVGQSDFSKWLIYVVRVSNPTPIHRPTIP